MARGSIRRVLAVAVIATAALLGVGAASVGAAAAYQSCHAYLTGVDVHALTGLSATLKVEQVPPGSAHEKGPVFECLYLAAKPPWGDLIGEPDPVAAVFVFYRSSPAQFAALEPYYQTQSRLGPTSPNESVRTVHVGHARAAFVVTDRFRAYYSVAAGQYPEFPATVYELYVLSKNDNILYMYFYNASLAQTKALAKSILGKYGSVL